MAKVSMLGLPGHEVSNLAAYGWEWRTKDGTQMQIVGLRGVSGTPTFSMRAMGPASWSTMKMADKWSTDGTRESFFRMVRAFLESGNKGDD